MSKKIKSFTVDEEAYNDLVKMFKDYEVDVSVSAFVDGCMKELISKLKKLERVYKGFTSNGKKVEVPFSNIINSMVFSKSLQQKDYEIADDELEDIVFDIAGWNDEYKAHKKGLSVRLYTLARSPLYEISPDKKYLIEKKSGKKEPIGKTKDGLLDLGKHMEGKKIK